MSIVAIKRSASLSGNAMIRRSLLDRASEIDEPTPYYVFDLEAISASCREMISAWSSQFPNMTLAYSYKTNPMAAITRTLRDEGAAAEVVSGCELSLALLDGHSPENIFFDGPVKTHEELKQALGQGVRIQIDSLAEVAAICDIVEASAFPDPLVSLRLAALNESGRVSRFGMTKPEARQAVSMLARRSIVVTGVHFNTGQHPMSASPYCSHLRAYADIIRDLLDQNRAGLFILDIGGGFPAVSCTAGAPIPHPLSFATGVGQEIDQLGIPRNRITLVIEPGRSLVEDHAVLVTSVCAIKIRNKKCVAIVDGGTNLVRSLATWTHPMRFGRSGDAKFSVYGAMCFESDIFATNLHGPKDLRVGEKFYVGAAGGYDIPSANAWLRPHPAVYGYSANGQIQMIRNHGEGIRI